jgi:transcription initiation factor TFIIIB Brf1 subunit/transcription initiation factor TFIIB
LGHGGKGDYSVWHYNITHKYASLKLGQNKITSKISCIASPSNVTKFNSVNVTDPMGLAATVLYISCIKTGENITQKDIAQAAGITDVTLRNRFKDLMDNMELN